MLEHDLKTLELQAFRSTFRDGLWDLFLGLIIFTGAVSSLLTAFGMSHYWSYSLIVAALALFFLGKRLITVPRLGAVHFGAERRAIQHRLTSVIVFSVVLAAGVWLIFAQSLLPDVAVSKAGEYVKHLAFGLLFYLLPFGILGLVWKQPRLILFGALTAVGESLYDYIPAPLNGILCFGIPGLLFFIIGSALLIQFVRTHPLQSKE